jgi:hypothetical protein
MRARWKAPIIALASILGTWLVLTVALLWVNNRPTTPLSHAQLAGSLERGIAWLDAHREEILEDSNPALWWMVQATSERVGGDPRLEDLLARYRARWMQRGSPVYLWRPLFGLDVLPGNGLFAQSFQSQGYILYLLYALTCDEALRTLDIIASQNQSDYCPALWATQPHCRTHQLMGLLWGLDRNCPGPTRAVALGVRRGIWREAVLDFRVDDAYIQRALLLTFAPSTQTPLKPIWMRRILAHQLEDGGWDGAYPALRLSASRYLVLDTARFAVRPPQSNFHATAQAVLLLARALNGEQVGPRNARSVSWADLGE